MQHNNRGRQISPKRRGVFISGSELNEIKAFFLNRGHGSKTDLRIAKNIAISTLDKFLLGGKVLPDTLEKIRAFVKEEIEIASNK